MLVKLQSAIALLTCGCLVSVAASPSSVGFVVTNGQVEVDGSVVHGNSNLPFAGRAAERAVAAHQMPTDLNQAVADLEQKLAANPDNLDGWLLLGRTEAARQHWQKSAGAMRHAAELAKDRPEIAAAYGQVLVQANGGLVTPEARDVFATVLKAAPDEPRSLWYLGLGAVQDHKIAAARDYWRKLLAALPADGDDTKLVNEALAALDAAQPPGATPK